MVALGPEELQKPEFRDHAWNLRKTQGHGQATCTGVIGLALLEADFPNRLQDPFAHSPKHLLCAKTCPGEKV